MSDKFFKCCCGRRFFTRKGLDDHCSAKGDGHEIKVENRSVSTLEYLREKSGMDCQSDDNFSFWMGDTL